MQLDQSDVDALLAEAGGQAPEVSAEEGPPPAGAAAPPPAQAPASVSPPPESRIDYRNAPPEILRILQLEVPVIVQLADRGMTMKEILELNVGSVIEFDKHCDSELHLVVTNRCIGLGHAVKVGENFGLRVTRIGTIYDKIRALGK